MLHAPSPAAGDFFLTYRWITRAGLIAVAYYLTGRAGPLVPKVDEVAIFWPAFGVAVALLFRLGLRHWPGLLVGAVAVNLPLGWPTAVGPAVGATAAGVLMAQLLKRYRLNPAFESMRDVWLLAGVAIGGTLASAVIGVGWMAAVGAVRPEDVSWVLAVRWLGAAAGGLLTAPVVLAWSAAHWRRLRRHDRLRGLLGLFGLNAAAGVLLYAGVLPNAGWALPAAFVPFLLVASTAAEYRAWPAAVQGLIVGLGIDWAGHDAHGAGQYLDASIRVYAAWAYLVTAAFVGLGLSALLAERDAVERKLKAGEETYRALVNDNPALICRFTTAGVLAFANETFRDAFACRPSRHQPADPHRPAEAEGRAQLLRPRRACPGRPGAGATPRAAGPGPGGHVREPGDGPGRPAAVVPVDRPRGGHGQQRRHRVPRRRAGRDGPEAGRGAAERDGGPGRSDAAVRGHRRARRRGGPRVQQHPHRRDRQHRPRPVDAAGRQRRPAVPDRSDVRCPADGRPDPAAQPVRRADRQPERAGEPVGAGAVGRGTDRGGGAAAVPAAVRTGRRRGGHPGRRGEAAATPGGRGDERGRGHGRAGRPRRDRAADVGLRARLRARQPQVGERRRPRGRRLHPARSVRHRLRHDRGHAGPRVRAILYHEVPRPRAGPGRRAGHRAGPPRGDPGAQPEGLRHDRPHPVPGRRPGGGPADAAAAVRPPQRAAVRRDRGASVSTGLIQ